MQRRATCPTPAGSTGFVQDAALAALDRAACRFGSSREELALALADEDEARAYERAHGVDPRSTDGLLEVLGISRWAERPAQRHPRRGRRAPRAAHAAPSNEPASRRASQPTTTRSAANGHGSTT